jgi:dipeptidase
MLQSVPVRVARVSCVLPAWLSCLLCVVLVFCCGLRSVSGCTTIVVGRAATVDGDPLLTHNLDCTDCDIRLAVVPARSHPPSASCPVVGCKFSYPRHVGGERGPAYAASHLLAEFLPGPFPESVPIASIPQVRHSFSYLDGSYPLSNEWGLSMGESTCSARLVAFGRPLGDAQFDITALMRLGMERCRTARCAIQLMGALAEEYGYYGSSDPPEQGSGLFEESGEAVSLIDAEGESWVFHILPDDTGRSAWRRTSWPSSPTSSASERWTTSSRSASCTRPI